MEKKKFSNVPFAFVALSIFEYYRIVVQKFLDRTAVYIKAIIFKPWLENIYKIEILRKMEQAFRNILNTLHITVQYILLVTTNMCFGLVIMFLIVKHILQNINIYESKYYTPTIF